jgi:glucose/arabinose dehydrogenase
MSRVICRLAAVVLVLGGTATLGGNTLFTSALHDYRVVTVVDSLVQPWSIAFLPGGDVLITERPGRLRVVRNGKLLPQPVEGVPKVFHSSQGGLLEVMPHPNFASNRLLYLTYSKPGATDAQATTTLVRGRFENDRLTNVQQLFEAAAQGRNHFSGKIAFDGKGYLFLSAGDRQAPPEGNLDAHPAQNVSNHQGKTHGRVDRNGAACATRALGGARAQSRAAR